jgi:hypothetical protein
VIEKASFGGTLAMSLICQESKGAKNIQIGFYLDRNYRNTEISPASYLLQF